MIQNLLYASNNASENERLPTCRSWHHCFGETYYCLCRAVTNQTGLEDRLLDWRRTVWSKCTRCVRSPARVVGHRRESHLISYFTTFFSSSSIHCWQEFTETSTNHLPLFLFWLPSGGPSVTFLFPFLFTVISFPCLYTTQCSFTLCVRMCEWKSVTTFLLLPRFLLVSVTKSCWPACVYTVLFSKFI